MNKGFTEIIDQIGGRERLELASRCKGYEASVFYPRSGQIELMARALLMVLDAKPVVLQGGHLKPDGKFWYDEDTISNILYQAGIEVKK